MGQLTGSEEGEYYLEQDKNLGEPEVPHSSFLKP